MLGEREKQTASAPKSILIPIAKPRPPAPPPPASPTPTPPGGWWYKAGSPDTVKRNLKDFHEGRWAGEKKFDEMDANKDGSIDRAEWHQAGHDDTSFERADTNHNGKIDRSEWAAKQQAWP